MKKKELEEMISNPLSVMNMNDLVKNSAERVMTQVVEKEFQGFKA